MIKAYLAAIPTLYEGEDIEFRYCVYDDEQVLFKESVLLGYRKPAIVGQFSIITLLKRLADYKNKEIIILINDASLQEFLKGTSGTRNIDMLKMARETRKHIDRFENLKIVDVSNSKSERLKWKNEVEF
jgi:hypothetical protein